MSSGINVYAVSIERLKQVAGSRDQGLIDAIVTKQADFLATIDEIDEEASMTCAEAVEGIINGEMDEDQPGYLYGYAVEALCAYLGRELQNIVPIAGASDWLNEIDELLQAQGVALRLSMLVYAGSPIPIPTPEDYPFIGQWSSAEIANGAAALQKVDLAGMDGEQAETLQQIRQWLEAAAGTAGTSLVGFLS